PSAVPKKVRVENVKGAGQTIGEEEVLRLVSLEAIRPPKATEGITFMEVWTGKDIVKRASMNAVETYCVEGALVVSYATKRGEEDIRASFAIKDIPVPPVPKR